MFLRLILRRATYPAMSRSEMILWTDRGDPNVVCDLPGRAPGIVRNVAKDQRVVGDEGPRWRRGQGYGPPWRFRLPARTDAGISALSSRYLMYTQLLSQACLSLFITMVLKDIYPHAAQRDHCSQRCCSEGRRPSRVQERTERDEPNVANGGRVDRVTYDQKGQESQE